MAKLEAYKIPYCRAALGTLLLLALEGGGVWASAPYADAEIRGVETSEEGKIREIRNQEIEQLRATLGRHFPASRQADLYFRLAEIYMEAYHTDYVLEGRVHDRRQAQGLADPKIDHSHSQPHLLNGIRACREIIAFRIPYSKMDRVFYFLGFNYGESGDSTESLKYFEGLVRQYPTSPFVVEGYRELGEAAFRANQFRKAIGFFENAMSRAGAASKGEPSENTPGIRHRLAWCFYRVKEFDRAIRELKLAIEKTRKNGEKFLSLREEALRDMAVFMTESGKVDEAIAYFTTTVGDLGFYPKILEKLGHQYERNVEPGKATQVYESLLRTHPGSDASFRVVVKLIDLDLRRGRFKEALTRLTPLQLPEGGSSGKSGEEDTRNAVQNLRAMIRRTATEHHEIFRKKGEAAALEIAEGYYLAYLQTFLAKDDPRQETPEIHMYLAEVKRERGKAAEASALYRKVVLSRDKRYAKEAGALWTASLAEAIKKSARRLDVKTPAPESPSELEKDFISASDALAENLGETSEGREAALRAAQVLAGFSSTKKDAQKRASELIRRWPKTMQAITAARLKLQILNERGDQSQAEEIKDLLKEYRQNIALMEADQELGKGALKAVMAEQDSHLRIGEISQSERDHDFAAAARGYEGFANDTAQADGAEKSYSSAIYNYLKSGQIESLDRVASAWLKRFPKSPKARDSLRGAATQLLVSGAFEPAARLFEKFGLLSEDPDSLETAARIREGDGDLAGAERNWTAHLEKFKLAPQHGAIALSLAKFYEAAGREADSARMFRLCMASSSVLASECGARLGDLYFRSKNTPEAKKAYEKVATGAGSPYVGYCRYRLAYLLESGGNFEPLALPEAKLKPALNQRLEFLGPLSKAYISAVDAGGPWAISALDRLAQWALRFADEVDQISVPSTSGTAVVDAFKKSLSAISTPLRKKAADTWSESYSKSLQAEVYNPVIPEIADRLADMKKAKPARAQGPKARFRLAGVPSTEDTTEGMTEALKKLRDRLQRNLQDAHAWTDYGNLLWGSGKPLIAKLAYDRALLLSPKNPAALNNRAVVVLSQSSEAPATQLLPLDALVATQAAELFKEALAADDFFLVAQFNLASLRNYYRLFEKASPLWEQVLLKMPEPEAFEGLAVALQGRGQGKAAAEFFAKAEAAGAPKDRFAAVYHAAARMTQAEGEGASKCLARLGDLDEGALGGFEKDAVQRLKRSCSQWKNEK